LDTGALATWCQRFHDPVLDGLIADALQSSPDVRAALSRLTEYRARRGVELAGLFPSLDATASEVLLQFLIEAVCLSCLGGIVGVCWPSSCAPAWRG